MIRRPGWAPLVGIGLAFALSACGEDTGSPTPDASPTLQGQIVASELAVGDSRVPIGILNQNTPINDATVHVRAFLLRDNSGLQAKGESDAPFKGEGLDGLGLYVAHLALDTPGNWEAEVTVQRPSGQHAVLHLPFNVVAAPLVPDVGQPAPRSHNPTARDVDVSLIDSGTPPDDMHAISIADAIAQHKPTLVVFASPAFCTSRTCGPEVRAVETLEPTYRDRLTFIHIEIYRDYKPDPTKKVVAQTVLDWRLQSDPWVFLIDSKGLIRARFEASTGADELRAAIDQLLASP